MAELFVFTEAQFAGRQPPLADVSAGVVRWVIFIVKHQPAGVAAVRASVTACHCPVAKRRHLPARQAVVIDLAR